MAKRDLSFEALMEVTSASLPAERGALNGALKEIRSMAELDDETLAEEIRFRARAYRKAMPEVLLTPSALAKHWNRVMVESMGVKPLPAAPAISSWECGLCLNDGWVFIAGTQDAAPCPECEPGAKVLAVAYPRGFWEGKHWMRSGEPQTVVVN